MPNPHPLFLFLLITAFVVAGDEVGCGGVEKKEKEEGFGGPFSTTEGEWGDSELFRKEMSEWVKKQEERVKNPDSSKFIIYLPVHTGMGNRLEGLVSTFLLAYLTDRALLVNFDYYDPNTRLPRIKMIEHEVLDAPFPWDLSLLTDHVAEEVVQEKSSMIELRGGRKTYDDVPLVEQLCCGDPNDFFDKQYVQIKGNKYYAQLFTSNPHFSDKLEKLFGYGTRRNMMAPLLGFLLHPKQHILDQVHSFLDQFKGKKVYGVQMRTTENYCEEAYLPIYPECIELFFPVLNTSSSSSSSSSPSSPLVVEDHKFQDDFVIFVSSDSESAREVVVERYGDKVVYHEDVIDMTTRQGRYRTAVDHGMKDILTLALADERLVTCGSSFSRVAIGLARDPAYVVSAGGNYCRQHSRATCFKGRSTESCCYHWFTDSFLKCSCFSEKVAFREYAICGGNM